MKNDPFKGMASNSDPVYEKAKKQPVMKTHGDFGTQSASQDPKDVNVLARGKTKVPLVARTSYGQSILGPVDRRTEIQSPSSFPWRMICSLEISAADGNIYQGTGWIAGPRLIVTAGHCVFDRRGMKGWATSIKIFPGRSEDTVLDSAIFSTDFHAPCEWTDNEDENYDYAAIILTEDISAELGFFSASTLCDADLSDRMINISGYPGSRVGEVQLHHANRILDVSTTKIYYDVDTEAGQSGAPIWIYEDESDQPIVVGIHSYGAGKATLGNSGVRITPKIVEFINEWSQLTKE